MDLLAARYDILCIECLISKFDINFHGRNKKFESVLLCLAYLIDKERIYLHV